MFAGQWVSRDDLQKLLTVLPSEQLQKHGPVIQATIELADHVAVGQKFGKSAKGIQLTLARLRAQYVLHKDFSHKSNRITKGTMSMRESVEHVEEIARKSRSPAARLKALETVRHWREEEAAAARKASSFQASAAINIILAATAPEMAAVVSGGTHEPLQVVVARSNE